MEVQSIYGYFSNGNFFQQGRRVSLPEHQLVIVNVLGIPVDIDDTKQKDASFWDEFDRMLADSADEELSLEDFSRNNLNRELVILEEG
jgi:hypothetical protein